MSIVRVAIGFLTGVAMCGWLVTPACGQDDAFFEKQVRPILVTHCYKCHAGANSRGGLRLDTRAGWQKGGDTGPAVVPGKPDESLLMQAVRYHDTDLQMPPPDAGGRLTDAEIDALEKWVRLGAPDPRESVESIGGMSVEAAKSWWAFQPLPKARGRASAAAIDRFLDEKLRQQGIASVAQADKRTLIRRATFDLTGLPPTPKDVETFVADGSAAAFATLVDRLLASPQYGVRYGRHWLDVVRYADTAGENSDRPLPHAWRYRNWVIDSFNRDVPFDEFTKLQLAGDILRAQEPQDRKAEGIVATGYLAVARRFGHDIDHNLHLLYEDVIDNLGKSFLGLTTGCARCHDHKYDPISAEDYYAIAGIFDSTRFAFPGCEPRSQPYDLVPLIPAMEVDAITKAAKRSGSKPVIPVAYAVAEKEPHDMQLQQGGDPERRGDMVPRRWLSVFGGQPLPSNAGSGRRELAGWISQHPLFARVVVNRVWQWHFGTGLVATSNDFGSRGAAPSHPELLDWLASHFVASGHRVKTLHRLIMNTKAYQRSSGNALDPNNRWLARFSRRRLSAEEIRDSLLFVSGQLDQEPGEAHPFPKEETWKFTQHAPFNAVYDTNKRSVYLMVQRQRRHPFLALFDGADPNSSTGRRQVTTVPTQALYFLNDPFFHKQANGLAERLERTASTWGLRAPSASDSPVSGGEEPTNTRDPRDRENEDNPAWGSEAPSTEAWLTAAFRVVFQRVPAANEVKSAQQFFDKYPGSQADKQRAYVRVLLASSEFIYVE
jgi:hypothetical protein